MEKNKELLFRAVSDLGINAPYIKGQNIPIKNCWHFSTDGNAVAQIFMDDEDFRDGMNRVYVLDRKYNIIILAFVLMDTHVHFLLYGEFDECNRFIHMYLKLTSQYISFKHKERKIFGEVPVSHQAVDNDTYLKVVICYIVKNPTEAGMRYLPHNYPYSSGALYFSAGGNWTASAWNNEEWLISAREKYGQYALKQILRTKDEIDDSVMMFENIVFPGEYVAYEVVEKIFRTCRSFQYFMGKSKELDVESKGGIISYLTVPIQEMRQNRDEVMKEQFNVVSIRQLNMQQRITLAKVLKNRYYSSLKQIVRICGLCYDEAKNLL